MATYTSNLSLKKPAQSDKIRIADLNGNADNIDAAIGADFGQSSKPSINAAINSLADGLAIVSQGDVHAAISAGRFVYVRNHSTLAEGLYVASAAISANAALSGTNLTADTSGGLNALNSKIATDWDSISSWCKSIESTATTYILKFGRMRTITFQGVSRAHTEDEILMTLPQGEIPLATVYVNGLIGSVPVIIRLNSYDGNVALYTANNAGAGRIYFSVSYVVNE